MRHRAHRRAVRRELLRCDPRHHHDGQGSRQRFSGRRSAAFAAHRETAQSGRHGDDLRRRTDGLCDRRSGHRYDRDRETARERAPGIDLYPRELRYRPSDRYPGCGISVGTQDDAPRQGSAGGAAREEHLDRHQRRSPRAALAAGLYLEREPCRPIGRRARADSRMRRFLDLADFQRDEVLDLLALAQALQDQPQPRALVGKILGLVFFNPSLRTLASFQAGMARLGGSSFVITPGQGTWQLETRMHAIMNGAAAEHIREGIPVLASYCDALGVRAFAEGKNLESDLRENLFHMIDELCGKPLINLESAINHPCQALAGWATLDQLDLPTRAQFWLC